MSCAVGVRIETPAEARALVRRHLADVEGFEDAVLLTSELVTNAIVHAHDEGEVVVLVEENRVRVEVHDTDGSTAHLTPLHVDAHTPHGRGLAIVEALAHRWGVEICGNGKTVWFEFDLDGVTMNPQSAAGACSADPFTPHSELRMAET